MTQTKQVAVVGHVCLDMTHVHLNTPLLNGKSLAVETHMVLGGCAANTARFLEELGVKTSLYSVLGDESSVLTQHTVRLLNTMGVYDKRFSFVGNAPATVSHVWVDNKGNRTISSYQAPPVVAFTPTLIDVSLDYQASLFDNYRWPLNLVVLEKLNPACIKIMDVDAPVTAQQWEYFKQFDQIWFSRETFADIKLNLSEVAVMLSKAQVVGVTDGENSVVWVDKQGIHQIQPPPVKAVNTLGAGDAFRAGMVAGLTAGLNMSDSVTRGCLVAGKHIQQL
jgi:sugar/nucleoside kinase (ribokinase family)